MKTDYSDLVGKRVLFINKKIGMELEVEGCDYHIGISLINPLDKKVMICLERKENLNNLSLYRKMFNFLLRKIKSGELNYFYLYKSFFITHKKHIECPFS